MQLSNSLKRKPLAINMTPMIDIVFLLLIFFITCSQVSQVNRESLELPRLAGSEDQTPTQIIANINAAGELAVSGREVSVPEFAAICLEEARLSQGGDAAGLAIVVRADRNGRCGTVNKVVEALTKLGVTKIRFAVLSQP